MIRTSLFAIAALAMSSQAVLIEGPNDPTNKDPSRTQAMNAYKLKKAYGEGMALAKTPSFVTEGKQEAIQGMKEAMEDAANKPAGDPTSGTQKKPANDASNASANIKAKKAAVNNAPSTKKNKAPK